MGGEVKRMRVVGALICLGVLVAGCGGTQQILRQTRGDKLYEAVSTHSSQLVSVIDSRSHTADRRLPMGVPTSDWKHLYSIVSTSLVDTDPRTGATIGTMPLGGAYRLPAATANGVPGGLSPNGLWLVVESFDSSQSHMLIVNTTTSTVRRKIDLDGYFQFDAISNDGDRLYLIQHLNGREYYVRLYDVVGGRLDENIVVDKSDGNQAMVGTRLSGIATPDGHMLFSMYVREHESPFIHALSLDGAFAFCLDLPGSGYADSAAEMRWSLAITGDGSRIYAANPATGVVAVISTGANSVPSVLRTARFERAISPNAKVSGANAAVVSRDGKTLVVGGASGLTWIDTSSLQVRAHALTGWHVSSVGLSPNGQNLYAVGDDGRIAEISMADPSVISRFDPSEGQPLALMRVAVS
jgi:DNA-binding beta-propeller fold protein YncE